LARAWSGLGIPDRKGLLRANYYWTVDGPFGGTAVGAISCGSGGGGRGKRHKSQSVGIKRGGFDVWSDTESRAAHKGEIEGGKELPDPLEGLERR